MQITTAQQTKLNHLLKKYQLKLIVLFGSQVKNNTTKQSDIDIAILAKKLLNLKQENLLFSKLSTIIQGNIDLSFLNQANPLFKYQIMKNSQLLAGNKFTYYTFKAQAVSEYIDFKKILKLEDKFIRQKLIQLEKI